MYKQAYAITVHGAQQYRMFPTEREAVKYASVAFRGDTVRIDKQDEYPNSQYVNNRVLTVRCRHV